MRENVANYGKKKEEINEEQRERKGMKDWILSTTQNPVMSITSPFRLEGTALRCTDQSYPRDSMSGADWPTAKLRPDILRVYVLVYIAF
jgi:hypothetical protein